MASMSPKQLVVPLIILLLALAAPAAAQQQQKQEFCRDTLAGLMECQAFMHDGAAASASCCAAYEAAFDADPFCLCYVADGTFARATGTHVDVARALQIPISCGQTAPPIELCNMEGLVLPPYEPQVTQPDVFAAAPEASAPAMQPGGDVAPPSFTTPPPPPAPTSAADPLLSAGLVIMFAAVVVVTML
ncbi:hypothetical protein QOZ80_9AG0684320 [Eleusine coracana subsp. coracana]|nr:hypothetical protein QOZ80_9AG0684320 [Eleusine coracana subsp. coracana]